jgi:hypothetical protein
VSAKGITDELVQQVANDLCARYGLDDEGMRALGSRLADSTGAPSAENRRGQGPRRAHPERRYGAPKQEDFSASNRRRRVADCRRSHCFGPENGPESTD